MEKVIHALQDIIGITPKTISGFITQVSVVPLIEAQIALSEVIAIQADQGLDNGTTNLMPCKSKNSLSRLYTSGLGIGNLFHCI